MAPASDGLAATTVLRAPVTVQRPDAHVLAPDQRLALRRAVVASRFGRGHAVLHTAAPLTVRLDRRHLANGRIVGGDVAANGVARGRGGGAVAERAPLARLTSAANRSFR